MTGLRESVPCTLSPGRPPNSTALRAARLELDAKLRRRLRVGATGRPRLLRSLELAGLPCPGGWSSDSGYCNHGCRCDGCRDAHRVSRIARMRRARAEATC
jgi:hypothetical protein